jgi:MYXO-CTERM domain-containing protein
LRQVSNFLTLTIPTTGPLIISSKSLPVGVIQQTYNFNLCGAGGTTPYSHDPGSNPSSNAGWSILDTQQLPLTADDATVDLGPMAPPGLTLDLGGKLSGTPNVAGKYALSIQVIDTSTPPQVATKVLQLNLLPTGTLFIVNTSQPTATVGKPYQAQLQTPEPSWDPVTFVPVDDNGATGTPAALASLPPGIMLSPSGALSGTPTAAGTFQFEVHIADAFGDTLNQGVQVPVVAPAPSPMTGPSGGCATTSNTSPGASLLAVLVLIAGRRRRPATPTRG